MSVNESDGCTDEACRNFRAQTRQIIESGRYLERIYEFAEYEKAIECVRKCRTPCLLFLTALKCLRNQSKCSHRIRVLEEENRFFIQRFEKEQKDHKEMLQKLQEHLKLSEKNRVIEKNRYKKKIDALKTELHGLQLKKPAAIDLLSNSSDDDQDEADDFEDDQNDLDDGENRNVHFQEQSSSTIPAVSGHRKSCF